MGGTSIKQGMSPRVKDKNHTSNCGACHSVVVRLHCICLTSGLLFTLTMALAYSTGTSSRIWGLVAVGSLATERCLVAQCKTLVPRRLRAVLGLVLRLILLRWWSGGWCKMLLTGLSWPWRTLKWSRTTTTIRSPTRRQTRLLLVK